MDKGNMSGTENQSESQPLKIKEEPADDIKDFAENTMNELLGWYGYDKVDREDTENLNLESYSKQPDRMDSESDLDEFDEKSSKARTGGQQRFLSQHKNIITALNQGQSLSPLASSSDLDDDEDDDDDDDMDESLDKDKTGSQVPEVIVCDWCQKKNIRQFTLKIRDAVKGFCSEKCFTQCRRAFFRKNKVCDWCKHVRPTMNYVDFQDGEQQLQFCGDKCLNQYKMNIFCKETKAHLQQIQAQVEAGTLPKLADDAQILITPDLWLAESGKAELGDTSDPKLTKHNTDTSSHKAEWNAEKLANITPTHVKPDLLKVKPPHHEPKAVTTEDQVKQSSSINTHSHGSRSSTETASSHRCQQTEPCPLLHHAEKMKKGLPRSDFGHKNLVKAETKPTRGSDPVIHRPVNTPSTPAAPSSVSHPGSDACSVSPSVPTLFRSPMTAFPMPFPTSPFPLPNVPYGMLPGMPSGLPVTQSPPVSMILPVPVFVPLPIPIPIPLPLCPHMKYSSPESGSSNRTSAVNKTYSADGHQNIVGPHSSSKQYKDPEYTQGTQDKSTKAPSPLVISNTGCQRTSKEVMIKCACCQVGQKTPSPNHISSCSNGFVTCPVSETKQCANSDDAIDLSCDRISVKEEVHDNINPKSVSPAQVFPPPLLITSSFGLPPPTDHSYSTRRGRILDAPPPPRGVADSPPPSKRFCRRNHGRDIFMRKGNLDKKMRSK